MRSVVFGLVFLFCFAISGFGAENEAVKDASVGVLKAAVAEAFPAVVLQQAGATGKAEWQGRIDQAQAKRSKGIRYVFVGLGMGVGGSVLVATGGASYSVDRRGNVTDTGGALRTVGALAALGGAGVFWYGIYNWLKGSDEVDNLDREGRANGFLTLVPTAGGAQVALNFSF